MELRNSGNRGANLIVERDKDFQCFGDHSTRPPLDVEIFVDGDYRFQWVENLTQNRDVIHLSYLTPKQDYSVGLRAIPSLDLSRTIYSPWVNFSFQYLPDSKVFSEDVLCIKT